MRRSRWSRTTVYGRLPPQDGTGTLSTRLPGESPRTERTVGLPTYEYTCDHCDKNFDVVQSFQDDPLTSCPTCGSPVRKVFGNVGIVFKGSGFYKTDSRNGGPKKKETESSTPAAAGSEGSGSGGDGKESSSSSSTSGDGAAKDPKPSSPTPSKSTEKNSKSGTPAGTSPSPSS